MKSKSLKRLLSAPCFSQKGAKLFDYLFRITKRATNNIYRVVNDHQ